MESLTTILIALGLAADAFAVSLTSGLVIKHIKINKAIKIALFFGIFQALMPIIGWALGLSFREFLLGINHWVTFGLLCFIGGKMIYESLQSDENEKKFNPLEFYTLLGLAIATSLDALAVGIGLSVIKSSIVSEAALIGLVTFWLSFLGVFIGNSFGDRFNNKVEILGGSILIIIGSKILWERFIF